MIDNFNPTGFVIENPRPNPNMFYFTHDLRFRDDSKSTKYLPVNRIKLLYYTYRLYRSPKSTAVRNIIQIRLHNITNKL